jgi:hypothetical protein
MGELVKLIGGFRMLPKTGRLAEEGIDVIKKDHSNCNPGKAFDDRIVFNKSRVIKD